MHNKFKPNRQRYVSKYYSNISCLDTTVHTKGLTNFDGCLRYTALFSIWDLYALDVLLTVRSILWPEIKNGATRSIKMLQVGVVWGRENINTTENNIIQQLHRLRQCSPPDILEGYGPNNIAFTTDFFPLDV